MRTSLLCEKIKIQEKRITRRQCEFGFWNGMCLSLIGSHFVPISHFYSEAYARSKRCDEMR